MCSSNSQIIICFECKQPNKKNNCFHFVTPAIKTITRNVVISILTKRIFLTNLYVLIAVQPYFLFIHTLH